MAFVLARFVSRRPGKRERTAPTRNNLITFYGRLVTMTKNAFSRELNLYSRSQQSDIDWRIVQKLFWMLFLFMRITPAIQ